MEMEKKNLAIIILAVVLAASGVGNIVLGIMAGTVKAPTSKRILRDADSESSGPAVLDPVDSWDSVSNDMIRHVCDNLWYYDLYSGPDFELEWRLATDYTWDATQTNLTVTLREHVFFHDGSPFTAADVKFTFDRITYFINATGTLDPDETHLCDPASLFYDMNGNPILNKTTVINDTTVVFELNKPNGVFIGLLSYDACAILSPITTPATEYLTLGEDVLIGTGPFKYVHYIAGEELKYERNELYWGPTTYWDEVIWVYYPDDITAGNAMLGGEVDYLGGPPTSLIATFQADDDLVFVNLNTSTIYRYWGLNNRKINNTNVRKAIAYAYNYTYYIEVIRLGYMNRANQFLPPGFPYYNASFTAPYYDTGIARQAMLDALTELGRASEATGLTADAVGVSSTNDDNWAAKTFFSYKVLEHEGWTTGQDMNAALANDLDKIGIVVTSDIMDWETYIRVSSTEEDRLEIFHTGWGPDYLDPFNMIEPLLNNMSSANHIQLQDQQIMDWLLEYEETDPADTPARATLIFNIQNRAINELYCQLPTANDKVMYVHHKRLGNVCYNIMRNYWVRDCYFIPGE